MSVFAYGLMPPPPNPWKYDGTPEFNPLIDELDSYGPEWYLMQLRINNAKKSSIGPRRANRPRRRMSVHRR